MTTICVFKLGYTGLAYVDLATKVDGAYYCDYALLQQLLL